MQQYMSDGDATQHRRCVVTSTVITAVRGHDFCAQLAHKPAPPPSYHPSPLFRAQRVRFYWSRALGRATRRVRDSAPPTEIKGYYKQNELGGAARVHGPGRVKTCGLSPIYNNIVIIGHRKTICSRVAGEKPFPGSCPEPSCYSLIRLAV